MQFFDQQLKDCIIRCKGFEAVAIQHELDHLDGKLFLDRISNPGTELFRRKH
ncbi:MAG: peptide deformylase [Thermodesulfobacteriota bacterium]